MLEKRSFALFIKAYPPRLGILVFIQKYCIILLICLLYPKHFIYLLPGCANVHFSITEVSNCPVSNCQLSNCPVSKCLLNKCPVSKCPVNKCPVSKCPGTVKFVCGV